MLDLVQYFLGSCNPESAQGLILNFSRRGLCRFACWLHPQSSCSLGTVEGRGCGAHCCVFESGRAVRCPGSLERQEVYSLLTVEALFHGRLAGRLLAFFIFGHAHL